MKKNIIQNFIKNKRIINKEKQNFSDYSKLYKLLNFN